MSFLDATKWVLRWPGLILYAGMFAVGYLWGHVSGGFMDGRIDAYKETE